MFVGDKLSLKGSLKRSPSQKSDSKSDLGNLESGLEQVKFLRIRAYSKPSGDACIYKSGYLYIAF